MLSSPFKQESCEDVYWWLTRVSETPVQELNVGKINDGSSLAIAVINLLNAD